jgi:hypothetical protein
VLVWSIGLSTRGIRGSWPGKPEKASYTLINTIFVRAVARLFHSGSGGNFHGSARF